MKLVRHNTAVVRVYVGLPARCEEVGDCEGTVGDYVRVLYRLTVSTTHLAVLELLQYRAKVTMQCHVTH